MAAIEATLAVEKPAFARAVRGIITGDAAGLTAELAAEPELVSARSEATHRASLLHYVSANGIEEELQSPVPNGDAIAAILLAAGAEVDAQLSAAAEAAWSTTLGLVASSDHPQEAGTGGRLVALLCSAGAAVDGPAGDGSPLATALAFGTLDCAEVLIARGARTDNPIFAAAAGRVMWLRAWQDGLEVAAGPPVPTFLPLASDRRVAAEQALVFAAMCGQTEVIRFLLDGGVDIHSSPPGSHWTATALHTAAGQGQTVAVDLCCAAAPIGVARTNVTDRRQRSGRSTHGRLAARSRASWLRCWSARPTNGWLETGHWTATADGLFLPPAHVPC